MFDIKSLIGNVNFRIRNLFTWTRTNSPSVKKLEDRSIKANRISIVNQTIVVNGNDARLSIPAFVNTTLDNIADRLPIEFRGQARESLLPFKEEVISGLQSGTPSIHLNDVASLYSLHEAGKICARRSDESIKRTLGGLIVKRVLSQSNGEDLESVLYDSALGIVGRLTISQLRLLALLTLIDVAFRDTNLDVESTLVWLRESPRFYLEINDVKNNVSYLETCGCCTAQVRNWPNSVGQLTMQRLFPSEGPATLGESWNQLREKLSSLEVNISGVFDFVNNHRLGEIFISTVGKVIGATFLEKDTGRTVSISY